MKAHPKTLRGWLRASFFAGPFDTLVTLAMIATLMTALPSILEWAVVRATFLAEDGQACREAGGACWAVLHARGELILFGIYPRGELWRPFVAMAILLALLAASATPALWRRSLIAAWVVGGPTILVLMGGGILGLAPVETDKWGGLPLTLILAVASLGIGFPLGVLLALGRRSALPVAKALSIFVIETVRGLPLVSLLFMAAIMLPLFLPAGITIDKLLRALAALTIFAAAYLAEVVRGGLQAIPLGQYEAAKALGLGYWRMTRLIILPQALRIVVPSLTNTSIVMIKNTSFVLIVGVFDMLASAKSALADPQWLGFTTEVYLFIAAVYFAMCYAVSRYSRFLETRFGPASR